MKIARPARFWLTTALLGSCAIAPMAIAPAAAQSVTINVPQGALEPALLALGQQAGLTFAFDSSLTEGRRTNGASGNLGPQAAVAQVLAGTGLSFAFTGPNTVRIIALAGQGVSAPAGAIVLDTVIVNADSGVTEGNGSYSFDGTTGSATGLELTARETPQSVSTVTHQQMVDAGDLNLKDALNQAPGVTTSSLYGDARWHFFARGSQVSNLQYDGVTLDASGQELSPDDMVIYDRVEIVRGATGLMDGAGDPSASVNLVRKRPLAAPRNSVEIKAYDYGNASLTLDSSRPLNALGTVRGRVLAYGQTGDTWRDAQSHKNALIYGALDIDLTDATELGLGISHQYDRTDGYAWGGFWLDDDGTPLDVDPTDNPAAAWEYLTRRETVAYADLTHRFDNDWSFRLTGRYADAAGDRLAGYGIWRGAGNLVHEGYLARQYERSAILKAVANGTVDLFGRNHQLSFGADWRRVEYDQKGSGDYAFPISDPSRPFTWVNGKPDVAGPVTWHSNTKTSQWGIFASGRFELAPALHMIAGGRLAWYETEASFGDPQLGPRGSSAFKVDAEPIPYLGLVYDVNDSVSVYASYTEIFRPQSNKDIRGVQLAPATGKNTELGVKAALFDGGLLATAAVFDTRMDGLPERIADASQCLRPEDGCYRAAEAIATRGADIELSGSPAPGWNISLGYTYADAAYDAGPRKGQRYNTDRIPRHIAKLSATYAFQGELDGLTLGGALRAQSEVHYDGTAPTGDAYRSKQGGYAVIDAMARYDVAQDTVLQVNIDNLLGREYLTGVDLGWPNLFYGQPRTVSLSLRKAF